jgi:hypothetical protein
MTKQKTLADQHHLTPDGGCQLLIANCLFILWPVSVHEIARAHSLLPFQLQFLHVERGSVGKAK